MKRTRSRLRGPRVHELGGKQSCERHLIFLRFHSKYKDNMDLSLLHINSELFHLSGRSSPCVAKCLQNDHVSQSFQSLLKCFTTSRALHSHFLSPMCDNSAPEVTLERVRVLRRLPVKLTFPSFPLSHFSMTNSANGKWVRGMQRVLSF